MANEKQLTPEQVEQMYPVHFPDLAKDPVQRVHLYNSIIKKLWESGSSELILGIEDIRNMELRKIHGI